jgi:DNA-3-methyladenine glycosylase I
MDQSVITGEDGIARCAWACSTPDYITYHDEEWGVPIRSDHALFERLSLEAFQSGLSWLTVLRKRAAFREVFAGFDPLLVADFGESEISQLLTDARIIRHRKKIESTIKNAQALAAAWQTHGHDWLTQTLLDFAPSERELAAQGWTRPPTALAHIPPKTDNSVALGKHLKAAGFVFLGPTTLYAAMQATGFVNDHVVGCARR